MDIIKIIFISDILSKPITLLLILISLIFLIELNQNLI